MKNYRNIFMTVNCLGDRVDDFLRTLGIEWSKNVLRDYGEPAQPTDSQCPFLRWGSVSFFQPNQLSILV